jgi:hypothetical protein
MEDWGIRTPNFWFVAINVNVGPASHTGISGFTSLVQLHQMLHPKSSKRLGRGPGRKQQLLEATPRKSGDASLLLAGKVPCSAIQAFISF